MNRMLKISFTILVLLLGTSCASENYSRYQTRSGEVAKLFESATVLQDHTYYYNGPSVQPDTIIAIHNSYTLQNTKYWNEVDITEKQLQDWNRLIANEYRMRYPYRGAYILAPDGSKIGVGYTKYRMTVIKFPSPGQITIWPPEPDPAQRRFEFSRDRF